MTNQSAIKLYNDLISESKELVPINIMARRLCLRLGVDTIVIRLGKYQAMFSYIELLKDYRKEPDSEELIT